MLNSFLSGIRKLTRQQVFLITLLFVFFTQLFTIFNPPLESAHAWRQSLTYMVARNFYQEPTSIIHPKVDIAGCNDGIMASELPVLPYLTSLGYKVTGFNYWLGHLINLIISFSGIYCFYLLIRKLLTNEKLAFYASLALLFSIWLMFSRKMMPDTFSVSMALISVYFLMLFLQHGSWISLVLFALLASLSLLSKIPAALIFTPVILLVFQKGYSLKIKTATVFAGIMALVLPLYWYMVKVDSIVNTHHFQLFFPRNFQVGTAELLAFQNNLFNQFMHQSFSGYIFSILSFFGLWCVLAKLRNKGIWLLMVTLPLMFYFMYKTGYVFATHSYYMIPLLPFLALAAGYGLLQLKFKYNYIVLLAAVLESITGQWNDYFIKKDKWYLTGIEAESNTFCNRNEKIICNGSPNPQLMFFLNKKGFSLTHQEILIDEKVNDAMNCGASWLVIDRNQPMANELLPRLDTLYKNRISTKNLTAYKLLP